MLRFKKLIIFLLLVNFPNGRNDFLNDCSFRLRTVFHGHCGSFIQNTSIYDGYYYVPGPGDYLYYIQDIVLTDGLFESQGKTKFLVTKFEPFIFTRNNIDGFTVWGPVYGLVAEKAKFANETIDGTDITEHCPPFALWRFKANILIDHHFEDFMIDMDPMVEEFSKAIMGKSFKPTPTNLIDFIQTGCILGSKSFSKNTSTVFTGITDIYVVLLTLLSGIAITLLFASRDPKRFLVYLKLFIESASHLKHKYALIKFRYLFALWLITIWLIKQYYIRDVFRKPPHSYTMKIIDSWSDLTQAKHLDVFTFTERNALNKFYNQKSPVHQDLTNEIYLAETYGFDMDSLMNLIQSKPDKVVLVGICENLRYLKDNADYGFYRRLHVSKSGNGIMPYFLYNTFMANEKDRQNLNYV